jgi:TolB-like protein
MKQLRIFKILALSLIIILPIHSFAYEDEINKLATEMATKINEKNKKKLAVVDFTDLQGNVTELGRFISEEMSVALADSSGDFTIVDRTHLKSIIREHKLSSTGLITPDTARQLGKISGVDALITGTLTPFGEKVRITIKVLDTNTADIISSVRGNIAKTKGIEELLSKGIEVVSLTSTDQKSNNKQAQKRNLKANTDIVKEASGFEFRLKKCKVTGGNLKCNFLVTNLKKPEGLKLLGTSHVLSRVINDLGDEFKSTGVELGNSFSSDTTSRKVMPQNIPIKASTSYQINKDSNVLAILEVIFFTDTDRFVSIQFRNIAIER